ncbi:hypothetical protein ABZW30_13395 [Kitasatospora sp. NPDC004669]|uniref:hypothetical protein n=1 Tax=Kitasatospora sp. NPDC004669 TaxID=3154555 RepID=UPI0033BBD9B7
MSLPGDKRRIQTAVLGSAASEEPLILPLEAIELDAFRRQHAADTFWCGLLLGGCGDQLTTKLYTDRVCHFAHFPDPTGLHVCERRARDVSSADHLYVKSAATAWLLDHDHQGAVHLREPLGSVVDIAFEHQDRGLRLHLDAAVAPVWDDDLIEPVLGTTVPVDVDTLVRRRYVHRVRLDSAGTSRRVRIGTQAPARDTEWFSLDECHMSPDGFRTPAVEEILAAAKRTAWTPFQPMYTRQPTAAQYLEGALKSGSMTIVRSECRTVEAGGPYEGAEARAVAGLLEQARLWLEQQEQLRTDLFGRLAQALSDGEAEAVKSLLTQVNFKAARERTAEQHEIAARAAAFLKDVKRRAAQTAREARLQPTYHTRPRPVRAEPIRNDRARAAHARMSRILSDLGRTADQLPDRELRYQVFTLAKEADAAGAHVTPGQRKAVDRWLARAERQQPVPGNTPAESSASSRSRGGADRQIPSPRRLPPAALTDLAAGMRGALKKAARERSATSWSKLSRVLDSTLLHPDDQIQVLLRVEDGTAADEPLLSSLLAVTDTNRPALYRELASRLGRQVPAPASEAHAHWQTEVLRLQQQFRYR